VKDIITMMREFQAENNRFQAIVEEEKNCRANKSESVIEDSQQDLISTNIDQPKVNGTTSDKTKFVIRPSSRLTAGTLSVGFVVLFIDFV